ncbi:MAG: dTDP-glucose 4,6-dehydratase [Candidatus Aenigmarchaeota archaeon]|nr:dTDP-glucose 4,6-dehydratase [Candidatus Aenigmarchaeota archaeon]
MNSKKILITGGCGFIGTNFTHHIVEKYPDYEVIVLDKLTYAGKKENLDDIINKITFIHGDICNKSDVEKATKDVDMIVNFAAESHVDKSIVDSEPFILTEVLGVNRLLEAVKKFNVEKFVQISTDEVYGTIESGSFKETDPLDPRNPYAACKASQELLTRSYFETFNLPILITRTTNNYGSFQNSEKFIPKIISNALQNVPIPLYGDGQQVRDWIYVMDNCEAIDLVLHKGKLGKVYNIRGNNEKRNIDVAKIILKILDKPESLITFVADRLGHDRRYSLDGSKIKKELSWESSTKFEDGIRKTIEWYRNNTSWWLSKN